MRFLNKEQLNILSYFNTLLKINKINLEKIGFVYIRNRNIVQTENYEIRLKKNENDEFNRFLIRKLKEGKKMEIDEVYYSSGFYKKYKKLSDSSVLKEFIEYLKYKEI